MTKLATGPSGAPRITATVVPGPRLLSSQARGAKRWQTAVSTVLRMAQTPWQHCSSEHLTISGDCSECAPSAVLYAYHKPFVVTEYWQASVSSAVAASALTL